MFYEDNFEKLYAKICKCYKNVFKTLTDKSISDESAEMYSNGDGVACCIDTFTVNGVVLSGYVMVDEKVLTASMFVLNSLDSSGKSACKEQYDASPLHLAWEFELENCDDNSIMLTFFRIGEDQHKMFEDLRWALQSLVEHQDDLARLQFKGRNNGGKGVSGTYSNKLNYTWRDARDKIVLFDSKYGDSDRIELTRYGEMNVYFDGKKVNIDPNNIGMIIGDAPGFLKGGSLMFFDKNNEGFKSNGNGARKDVIILISKEFRADFKIVIELLKESLTPRGVNIMV